MNTFMNDVTLNKVMDEVTKFERRVETCNSVFNSRFTLSRNVLERNLDSIVSSLRVAMEFGYISHDEWVGIYGDIERIKAETTSKYSTAEQLRVGEDEYTIRWLQHIRNCTREEAEKEYFEEWVD